MSRADPGPQISKSVNIRLHISPLPVLFLFQPKTLQTTLRPLHNDRHDEGPGERRHGRLERIRVQPRDGVGAFNLPHLVQFVARETGADDDGAGDFDFVGGVCVGTGAGLGADGLAVEEEGQFVVDGGRGGEVVGNCGRIVLIKGRFGGKDVSLPPSF